MTGITAETLGTIAQLGLGLAGFSGIALVLMRGGEELDRMHADRLGIMLGSSLGAMFLAVLPLVLTALPIAVDTQCRIATAVMAAYTAGFLRFYIARTLRMRPRAPELVRPLPFGSVIAGHTLNLVLQSAALFDVVPCAPAYLAGLFWMLFHGAFQFGRILFVRPRSDSRHTHSISQEGVAECYLSDDDRRFVQAFEDGDVTPDDFDHRAHVRLAYAYLADADPDEAAARMRAGLLSFLRHHGIDSGKYHETLTRAWVLAVRHFMEKSGSTESADAFIAANPELLDSKIMLTHYSAAVLFSNEARARFVEPDLDAIPRDER